MSDTRGLPVGLRNVVGERINPATEEKQDELIAAFNSLLTPKGATGHGQVTLDGTWKPIPAIPPADDYIITFDKEDVNGTVRWSYDNSSGPSSTQGLVLRGNPTSFQVEGGTSIYMTSTDATDLINYTYKVI